MRNIIKFTVVSLIINSLLLNSLFSAGPESEKSESNLRSPKKSEVKGSFESNSVSPVSTHGALRKIDTLHNMILDDFRQINVKEKEEVKAVEAEAESKRKIYEEKIKKSWSKKDKGKYKEEIKGIDEAAEREIHKIRSNAHYSRKKMAGIYADPHGPYIYNKPGTLFDTHTRERIKK
jgi:hypothetical protein